MSNNVVGLATFSGRINAQALQRALPEMLLEEFYDAISALRYFSSNHCDVAVCTFELPVGIGHLSDRVMGELWRHTADYDGGINHPIRHAAMALDLVAQIRQTEMNTDTPIIVADFLDPVSDGIHPFVERRVLAAGASCYLQIKNGQAFAIPGRNGHNYSGLVEEIKKLLQ